MIAFSLASQSRGQNLILYVLCYSQSQVLNLLPYT